MWCVITVLVVVAAHQSIAHNLIVNLQSGQAQGTTISTPSGKTFYAWRGIPFAKPPLGDLRFKHPQRPEPWDGVLDATKDSKACLNSSYFGGEPRPTYGFSEDCLYVNVYAPIEPNSSVRLPVIFFIYGGAYYSGNSNFNLYDPTPFLEEGVIVVTFNYRLTIFGFLSTEDQVLPGNNGLKDQWLALLWTKENIHQFGGNPQDITLIGESVGAASVGYHILSPMSKNLFGAAIMESGSSLLSLVQYNARQNAFDVARKVDSSISESSSSEDVLKTLQATDADLLVNVTSKLGITFAPILEVNNMYPFLTKPCYESLESGDFHQVPTLIGMNSEELIFMFPSIEEAKSTAAQYDSNYTLLLPRNLQLKEGVNVDTLVQEIKQQYVGNGTFVEDYGAIVRWTTDDVFRRSGFKQALLQSKYSPVYFYVFSFVGTISRRNPAIPGCGRVAHGDELAYLFNISTKPLITDADFLTRQRTVKLWTNFVKFRNPTPDESSELLQNVKWEQLNGQNQYLDIGENLELKYHFKSDLPAFWDYLWDTYVSRPYNSF
ncbi:unnamed protein product [Ceutorhynchus assimilis]|uniref:Carboxylesterase type B domain-containing protein n=1 Tax=Ceutorhynchus assimilis TaxID=467358 RepID=A0A9N9N282_9CUCU|nr:unnamed protein product [Ceutorhynchus assimilis]